MNIQFSQPNLKNRKLACSDTLSPEALSWLFGGIFAIAIITMTSFVYFLDWGDIEKLPKAHGFIYVVVGLSLVIVPVLALVWIYPTIARLLFSGVYRITLHENGLAILAHKEKSKFYMYQEFDRISAKQSDNDIAMYFFKGEKKWVFMLQKYKNEQDFERVVHLAAKFS